MKSCYFLQTFSLVLLILIASSVVVADEGGDTYPELPEFAEGVAVNMLNRMDSCVRQVVEGRGEWLELDFTATQKDDEGTDQEFDSTKSKGRSFFIQVDAEPEEQKHPGLREGLRGVCVGEKREITIQAGSPLMTIKSTSGLTQPDTDKDAVYVVTIRSIQDQEPTNLFAKMDKDNNMEISREELKSYFENHGLAKLNEDGTLDQIVENFMQTKDVDSNGHLSETEFPTLFHGEL